MSCEWRVDVSLNTDPRPLTPDPSEMLAPWQNVGPLGKKPMFLDFQLGPFAKNREFLTFQRTTTNIPREFPVHRLSSYSP
jgi:hypothetical protein